VPDIFQAKTLLGANKQHILDASVLKEGNFAGLASANEIPPLKSGGDPWKEAENICRASFALSFSLVPPEVAPVDDQSKQVSLKDIFDAKGYCGEDRFWNISRAIMHDAAVSIAMFWKDLWWDFVKGGKEA